MYSTYSRSISFEDIVCKRRRKDEHGEQNEKYSAFKSQTGLLIDFVEQGHGLMVWRMMKTPLGDFFGNSRFLLKHLLTKKIWISQCRSRVWLLWLINVNPEKGVVGRCCSCLLLIKNIFSAGNINKMVIHVTIFFIVLFFILYLGWYGISFSCKLVF